MIKIETDLAKIKKVSKLKEEENFKFRSFLKWQEPDEIDALVHKLYEDVLEHIDCTECANCCIELETCFNRNELVKLTEHLDIDADEFIKTSTKSDALGDNEQFILKSTPCQFLKDKKCTIYEVRPEECNSYPYLHKEDFISRLLGVIQNYEICPIVYNVYEHLKIRLNFKF